MADVLLATSRDWPDGEPDGVLLVEALADRGVTAAWACWDDPDVEWGAARLVVVRSTWDYTERPAGFLAWARDVEARTRLLHGSAVFAWNVDKTYLSGLPGDLPVVPTLAVDGEEDLPAAIAEFGTAVVKPRIGAGGFGVTVFDGTDGGPADLDESGLLPPPWVVQPLVESIHTEGETSVFLLGGHAVSQVDKTPAPGEIRVHEYFGGRSVGVPLRPEAADLAERATRAVEAQLGTTLAYGRADMMRLADGRLALSELELVEPGLYLDIDPAIAGRFADLVAGLLTE